MCNFSKAYVIEPAHIKMFVDQIRNGSFPVGVFQYVTIVQQFVISKPNKVNLINTFT